MSDDPIDWPAFVARLSIRTAFPFELALAPPDPVFGEALVITLRSQNIHDGTPLRFITLIPLVEMTCPVEALGRIRRAVHAALKHEADECLMLDGRQVRDPHVGEPVGLRLVDRGITALIDDAEAIADLRRMVTRRSPSCTFCGKEPGPPEHRAEVSRVWTESRRRDVEAYCERANESLIAGGGASSGPCAHQGPLSEWSDGSRFVCHACGRFVPGSAAEFAASNTSRTGPAAEDHAG